MWFFGNPRLVCSTITALQPRAAPVVTVISAPKSAETSVHTSWMTTDASLGSLAVAALLGSSRFGIDTAICCRNKAYSASDGESAIARQTCDGDGNESHVNNSRPAFAHLICCFRSSSTRTASKNSCGLDANDANRVLPVAAR